MIPRGVGLRRALDGLVGALRRQVRDGVGWIPVAAAAFLLLGTSQAYTVPFTGLGLPPAQLLLVGLALLWVLTRLTGQRHPVGLGLLSGLIVVRLCCLLISYGLGVGRPLTPDQQTASAQALVVAAVSAVVVVVVVTLLRTRRDVERVLRAVAAGGALSGALALVQYATGIDVAARLHLPGLRLTIASQGSDLVREGVLRSAGAAAQPLELAAVATAVVPIAAACYVAARGRGERAWPWALAAALMAGGGVVSLSRSVFIGLAAAGVVMCLRWPVVRCLWIAATGLVLGAVALVAGGTVVGAVVTLLTRGSGDFSLGSRTVGRQYVLAHLGDHFWWGQGPGTYDLTRQPVLDNQYLSQLVETGVLGLVLYVAVLGWALRYALLATGPGIDPGLRELATGVAGSLTAVLVVELVLDTAAFVQISTLTWLLVGIAAAVWRIGVGPGRPVRSARPLDADPVEPVLRPAAAVAR